MEIAPYALDADAGSYLNCVAVLDVSFQKRCFWSSAYPHHNQVIVGQVELGSSGALNVDLTINTS
jgi:hypothetical protein